jgi:hypothetical protein
MFLKSKCARDLIPGWPEPRKTARKLDLPGVYASWAKRALREHT